MDLPRGGATDSSDLVTIPEIVERARQTLPRFIWDYLMGGAESEATLRRNRRALEAITFRTRVLRDVHAIDLSTSFLGLPLSLPVMMAPVGSIGFFDRDGALACARAAGRSGTVPWVGTMAIPRLEDVAAGATGPLIFQLYVRGDREWIASLVHRAEASGYRAICLTADSAVYGRRERDIENRFRARDALPKPNVVGRGGEEHQAMMTWEDVRWLRQTTHLPLILKGVMSAEDAVLAVEHGFEAVCVSNHGGRQTDFLPATIEVLPEIVEAVAGRAEVVVDSGFMRGTDVVKALALGARAVLIGKLMSLGLAAGGDAGLERTIALLAQEMRVTMGNLGARNVSELGPHAVRLPRYLEPEDLPPLGDRPRP